MSYERRDNSRFNGIIAAMLLGQILGRFVVAGVRSCNSNHPIEDVGSHTSVTAIHADVKEFNPGEHIISVPYIEIEDKRINDKSIPRELPYHPGYRVVGMSHSSILYVNNEKVTCSSTNLDKDNKYVYDNFGIPENYEKTASDNTDTKTFDIGEHVILKPITDPRKGTHQYLYVDGYEVIDVSAQSNNGFYQGGYILYRNTQPVECTKTEDGYNNFGKVINNKKLVLKQ